MIVLLVTFLFLQWGHTLVPMNIVQTGESVTFKCPLPSEFNERDIYWYKQRPGDNLRLILKVSLRKQQTTTHKFEPEFPDSRWKVNNDQKFSNLTLLKATYSDEGFYHCELSVWTGSSNWSGTYLMVTENTVNMSDNTVIQQLAASNPVRPGDTATFQCSVLFDSETMACSEDFSMFWFQAKSNNTYPNMIYTNGNKHHECEKRSDSEKSCMFNYSKVVNSSDSGIFYCAVTSCGKILFGNGTRLEIVDNTGFESIALVTTVSCLVFSLILNVVLICYGALRARQKRSDGMESTTSQETSHRLRQRIPDPADGGNINYAAVDFSKRKEKRGGKKKKMEPQECLYSDIKSVNKYRCENSDI